MRDIGPIRRLWKNSSLREVLVSILDARHGWRATLMPGRDSQDQSRHARKRHRICRRNSVEDPRQESLDRDR